MMAAGGTEGPGTEKPVWPTRHMGYCGPEEHLRGSMALVCAAKDQPSGKVCAQFDHQQMDTRALQAGWWLFDMEDFR